MIIIYYHKISTMNWSLCGHKIWSAKYLEHYKRYYYKLRALKFFIQVWFFIAKINRLNPIVGASCLILLLFINVTFTGHANIHSNNFWAFLPLPPPPPPPNNGCFLVKFLLSAVAHRCQPSSLNYFIIRATKFTFHNQNSWTS